MVTAADRNTDATLRSGLTINAGRWRVNVPIRLRIISFRCPWFEVALFWRRRSVAPVLELAVSGPAPLNSALGQWDFAWWRREADVPGIPYRAFIAPETLLAVAGTVASERESQIIFGSPDAPLPGGVIDSRGEALHRLYPSEDDLGPDGRPVGGPTV